MAELDARLLELLQGKSLNELTAMAQAISAQAQEMARAEAERKAVEDDGWRRATASLVEDVIGALPLPSYTDAKARNLAGYILRPVESVVEVEGEESTTVVKWIVEPMAGGAKVSAPKAAKAASAGEEATKPATNGGRAAPRDLSRDYAGVTSLAERNEDRQAYLQSLANVAAKEGDIDKSHNSTSWRLKNARVLKWSKANPGLMVPTAESVDNSVFPWPDWQAAAAAEAITAKS